MSLDMDSLKSSRRDRSFAHDVDPCSEGFLQLAIESAHLEQSHALRGLDAEIIVTVGAVVTTGPGAEEVHSEYPVLGGDGPDYMGELLERVLLYLVHGYGMVFTLYRQGSGPVQSPYLSHGGCPI